MALRPGILAGSLMVLLLATACGGRERVVVEWTGADTGRATLDARASVCAGVIELFATSGDTGVAMLLLPKLKESTETELPVLGAAAARNSRPAAAVAARWLDSARVDGYRGVKGTVRLATSKKTLNGDFSTQLNREGDEAEVTLTGQIRGVTVGVCADSGG
jgi:hypothetical protein